MTQDNKMSPPPQTPPGGNFNFNQIVHDLWMGNLPLLQVFWLYCFSILLVLKVLGDMLGFLSAIFALFELIWAGFMIKPVFLAADRYKGAEHWAQLAKGAVVGIGLLVLFDVFGKLF